DGLNLNGYEHHRVYHNENEFARGKRHVNGIENFWSFAKRRLSKFNGCKSDKFVLHLKECEWRYNHRNDDLVKILKEILTLN
ncbi:MAG: transposase, partial [Spirochaetales bacterium]|nr:transposase [Spirochaetales bacterium]